MNDDLEGAIKAPIKFRRMWCILCIPLLQSTSGLELLMLFSQHADSCLTANITDKLLHIETLCTFKKSER